MRAFIVTCLFGLALAAPQGYNYQAVGNLQLPAIPLISSGVSSYQQQTLQQTQQQVASIDEQRLVQQALQAPKLQQLFNTGATQQSQTIYQHQQPQQQIFHQQQPQQQQQQFAYNQPQQQLQQHQSYNHGQAPVVSKDIYVHVPPQEEPEQSYQQPAVPVGPPRKHYRIVFIKAPTPSVSKQALRVQQAPVEEKTIIYVLTKKPDPIDLQAAIEEAQAPKAISKPEVFFIKYKTQEEAAHAQRTIQEQYDQLGGTTQVSDEGVAPVTSVIGSLDNQHQTGASLNAGSGNQGAIGSSNGLTGAIPTKYLPAHLRA